MHCRLAPNVSVLISLLFSSIQVGCRLNARQNVFPRSKRLLFLPFTRVQFNNTKRGIQIPHTCPTRNRRGTCRGLLLSGGSCPGGGTCPGVDVLHSYLSVFIYEHYCFSCA